MKALLLLLLFVNFTKTQEQSKAYVQLTLKNRKNCTCILKTNNQKITFTTDTISFNVTKGLYKFNISCTNGASVNFNVEHNSDTSSYIKMKFDIESLKNK